MSGDRHVRCFHSAPVRSPPLANTLGGMWGLVLYLLRVACSFRCAMCVLLYAGGGERKANPSGSAFRQPLIPLLVLVSLFCGTFGRVEKSHAGACASEALHLSCLFACLHVLVCLFAYGMLVSSVMVPYTWV